MDVDVQKPEDRMKIHYLQRKSQKRKQTRKLVAETFLSNVVHTVASASKQKEAKQLVFLYPDKILQSPENITVARSLTGGMLVKQ